ncbi:phage tail protein [Fodinicola acaciae]|uniref:phage tail protein n=1 Tax=Fodinicola acaciae TaxID=2681555 RepID=UPI0013D0F837|nr:phage tail protein [Fodinicola acaciae]
MRNAVTELPTAYPIGAQLPAVYLEDEFTQRLTDALDQVLAPVFAVLDCFAVYIDPRLAPPDFLDWLSEWVAVHLDEGWTPEQRRTLVTHAVHLHRWRGTAHGLSTVTKLLTGGQVEVADSGGCSISQTANSALPGSSPAQAVVRLRVPDPDQVDLRRLRSAVAETIPAHVAVRVEVSSSNPAGPKKTGASG